MQPEDLKRRTKDFGLNVIQLIESLPKTATAYVLGKQLLRSATSVGANYRAACRAKSRNDFLFKINVVEEEADESAYWLELLMASRTIEADTIYPILKEANELAAIFTASGRTVKMNRNGGIKGNSQFAIRNSK